jgi:hypothetical protein
MRLFKVKESGKFTEYKEKEFKQDHYEETLESWLESNPDSVLEDGKIMVIGRQVLTNLDKAIDLVALDRAGNTVIIELKRGRTPRDVIAQALEYSAFVETLNYEELEAMFQKYTGDEGASLLETHKEYYKLDQGESVSFNKDQRIVVVGTNLSPEIRQTALFLRKKKLLVTCAEFKYFKDELGETLLSSDVVVGKEGIGRGGEITTAALPKIDKKKFLDSVDEVGRPFFEAILKMAEENELPVHWGSKGFSLNVDISGKHVAVCYGMPPKSISKESLYTAFSDIQRKIGDATGLVESFRKRFERTGIFFPTGFELKLTIKQDLTQKQIDDIKATILDLAKEVKELGLAKVE